LLADLFWLRKVTTDPYILSQIVIECPIDRYTKFKLYSSLLIWIATNTTSSIRNTALHNLTLMNLTVACFVGTGDFLIKHSNDHTK